MGQISDQVWQAHLQGLYHQGDGNNWAIQRGNEAFTLFNEGMVKASIKRLAGGKAHDYFGWMVQGLKWVGEAIVPCITTMFNYALRDGFPEDWQTNLIVPLYKARDHDNPPILSNMQ
eukprot:c19575_g1_i1 orf=181-531(+)